jgi:hypothetical protein
MPYDERGPLEIEQDLPYQRRAWRRQRIMWVLLTLVLIGALLGLFGPGVLGDAVAGDRNAPLWLEYNRFGHWQAETTTLLFHVAPAAARDGQVRLWLNRAYLERARVLDIMPQPDAVEAAADRYTFVFRAPDLSTPTTVSFQLEPERPGRLRGQAGLVGGAGLDFNQFVYP